MALIAWDDKYALGIDMVDKHHRHLFEILNTTYDEFIANAPPENLGAVLHELINYATYHFYTEERIMSDNSYPGFTEHKSDHDNFVHKIISIQKGFHKGNMSLTLETITFLKSWITQHILDRDMLLGEFMREKQAGASCTG